MRKESRGLEGKEDVARVPLPVLSRALFPPASAWIVWSLARRAGGIRRGVACGQTARVRLNGFGL